MSSFGERVRTTLLAVAACAMAASLVHREFFARRALQPEASIRKPPDHVPEWRQLIDAGILLGDRSAPVTLIEFADLECPACRLFQVDVQAARTHFGTDLAVVFLHFPLPQHRFARPAARVAECADRQGRFDEFHNLVYEKQDSIGLKSWDSFAAESGVPDLTRFRKCAGDTASVSRIEAGVRIGKELAVAGTPTVLLNGWRFWNPPSRDELLRAIEAIKAGKEPE